MRLLTPSLVLLLHAYAWASPLQAVDPGIHVDGMEPFTPELLRFVRLELRDPHIFTEVFQCFDVTDEFNGELDSALNTDGSGDGFLDASPLLLMEPFSALVNGRATRADGLCTAPADTAECESVNIGPVDPFSTGIGACLNAPPETTSGYDPPVPVITGDSSQLCFTTPARDTPLTLDGIVVELLDSRVAGHWDLAASGEIQGGLLRGFISESQAEAITVPDDVDIIGGQTLASLLPGGQGNCASGDDRDSLGDISGWWFYFEYDAEWVPATP